MRILPLVLLLGLAWTRPSHAQAPSKPPVTCKAWGTLTLSVGAAWSDQAIAAWAATGPYSIASTDRIAQLVVKNTHATQNLFVLLRASAAEATTAAHYVGAGAAQTFELWGGYVGTISFQGSGAATTARVDACIVSP